ncbi:MAG: COX15/CtaA family protein [Pseudobdellovibrio sp.]
MDNPTTTNSLKKWWLLGFCFLVILMVFVGGVTRLTRSGLSIVEWKPISGIVPPLTESAWQEQFDLYKQTPEFTHVNSQFELSDYKQIFMWEYVHRVLGRLIFLFIVIPGAILWRKRLVSGKLVLSLAGLVALQGLIGWLMVKSGLNVKPHVSPFMLALHFFTAVGVLLFAYYNYLKTYAPERIEVSLMQKAHLRLFGFLLVMQIFFGCITSGLKAGIGYNTYPLMNGDFFPTGGLFFSPLILNFVENPATVQWTHRWLGMSVLISFIVNVVIFSKFSFWKKIRPGFLILFAAVSLQVLLGILNIIFVVPVPLAATHQLVATLLIVLYFRLFYLLPVSKKAA